MLTITRKLEFDGGHRYTLLITLTDFDWLQRVLAAFPITGPMEKKCL